MQTDQVASRRLSVHPAAAVFPMLPPDELAALAADIAAHGLREPIMLDALGVLIDGRNRYRACELAEVKPQFATLPAHIDPVAYILSANVHRRHLTAGGRAMAVALMRSLSPGDKAPRAEDAAQAGIASSAVGMADVVLEWAQDLAEGVMHGDSLKVAYAEAQRRREAQAERDQAGALAAANLRRLQAEHPDLAELVAEERLPLADAIALADKREQEARDQRRRMTGRFAEAAVTLWSCIFETPEAFLEQWDAEANPWDARRNAAGAPLAHLWTGDGLHQLAARLEQLADAVDANGGGL